MSDARANESAGIEEIATLAGGCFWCLDAVFREMAGVRFVVSGYAGGHDPDPTYQEVCTGTTGHAEVVQVTYNPEKVTYRQLLELFWKIHDPTTYNRQGPDVGSQYRSAVFVHTPEQRRVAAASLKALRAENRFERPVVTEIVDATAFYAAEEYHQRYLEKQGRASCRF